VFPPVFKTDVSCLCDANDGFDPHVLPPHLEAAECDAAHPTLLIQLHSFAPWLQGLRITWYGTGLYINSGAPVTMGNIAAAATRSSKAEIAFQSPLTHLIVTKPER